VIRGARFVLRSHNQVVFLETDIQNQSSSELEHMSFDYFGQDRGSVLLSFRPLLNRMLHL
jgi:hypothetical protein